MPAVTVALASVTKPRRPSAAAFAGRQRGHREGRGLQRGRLEEPAHRRREEDVARAGVEDVGRDRPGDPAVLVEVRRGCALGHEAVLQPALGVVHAPDLPLVVAAESVHAAGGRGRHLDVLENPDVVAVVHGVGGGVALVHPVLPQAMHLVGVDVVLLEAVARRGAVDEEPVVGGVGPIDLGEGQVLLDDLAAGDVDADDTRGGSGGGDRDRALDPHQARVETGEAVLGVGVGLQQHRARRVDGDVAVRRGRLVDDLPVPDEARGALAVEDKARRARGADVEVAGRVGVE
jgi:hypothetical protein